MTSGQLAEAREAVTEAPLTPYPDLREAAVALLAEVDRLRAERADLTAKYVDAAATVAEQALKGVKRARIENAVRADLEAAQGRVAELEQQLRTARAAGLLDAAAIVDNDDDCECGGCDTCVPRALARQIRDRAYDVARGGAA
jgi:hypothetical protein